MECTLCNRKFKNIPALNGHMRLHGGYYKKDQEKGNGRLTPFSSPSSSVSPSLGEKRKPSISSTINGLTVFHAKKEDLQISPKAPPSSSTSLLNHSSLTIEPAAAAVDLLQPPPSKRHLLSTEGNTFIARNTFIAGATHPPSDSTQSKHF